MFEIITERKALNAYVKRTVTNMKSVRDRMHVALVSSLVHAAAHGGLDESHPLNVFYNALTSNEKTSVRQYLDRCFLVVGGIDVEAINDASSKDGEPLDPKDTAKARKAGQWLGYSKDNGFFVKKDTQEARDAFGKLAEADLINPDGSRWVRWMDRNNIAEMQAFGNAEFLKQLTSLANKASGGTKKVASTVDPANVEAINELLTKLGGSPVPVPNEVNSGPLTPSNENPFTPANEREADVAEAA